MNKLFKIICSGFRSFGKFIAKHSAAIVAGTIAVGAAIAANPVCAAVLDTALEEQSTAAIAEGTLTAQKGVAIFGFLLLIGVAIRAFRKVGGK